MKKPTRIRAHGSVGYKNKPQLLAAQIVGCFYCLHQCSPKDIKTWVDEGQTGLCPKCQVDSLIARNPNESAENFKTKVSQIRKERFGSREVENAKSDN